MSETIKNALKKLMTDGQFPPVVRGKVLAVDKTAMTCQVQLIASDAILEDVKINPMICDGDTTKMGIVLYPAINSLVLVAQVEQSSIDTCLISITQIESIALDTATAFKVLLDAQGNLNLNAVKMVFNQGKNGGVPLVNPLVSVIAELQGKVNSLITAFATHVHTAAGSPTTPPTPTPALQPETIVKVSDLASTLIIQ